MNWPIVKLWGRLDSHQPCAVYVHGCFPYFYAAPLEDDDAARRLFADPMRRRELCRRVAKSLDAALRGNDSGQDNGTCARVRAVTSALLTPFYGYASEPAHFLRVALYRPGDVDVRRAARLLLEGHLVELEGRPLKLQPYESHVNHHMRFFADPARARALALQNPTFRHAPPAAAGDGGRRWTAERVRGLGLGSRRRRRGAADAVEIDVAYGSVAPRRSDGRPASTYAVPALRDLFDEEAARLRADGFDEAAVEDALKVDACWLSPALSPSPPKPVTLGAAAPAEQAKWNAALEALRAAPPEVSGDDRGGGEISASQLDADDERRRSDEDEAEYERRMTQHERDGDDDDDVDDDDEEAEAPRADEDDDDDAPPVYATYESDDDDDVAPRPLFYGDPRDVPRRIKALKSGRATALGAAAPPDADLEHWRRLETRFADRVGRWRRRFWRGRVVLAPVADPRARCRGDRRRAPRDRASEASFLTPVDALRTPKSTGPGSGARDGATMRAAVAHVAATCRACLDVVTALDVLGRNLAIARLFGMPLDDALSRGSQHRVDAVLFPVSKPRRGRNPAAFVDGNGDEGPPAGETWYALRSPDGPAVANQPALEVVALNLEPVSAVYTEPVACLDFQSLYPSMVIAHNLCFSTCICKLRGAARPPRAGTTTTAAPRTATSTTGGQALDRGERKDWRAPGATDVAEGAGITTGRLGVAARWPEALARRGLLAAEADGARAYVAPNGAVFAPKAHREGVLPRMLREILAARIMTKQALKRARGKRRGTLARVLDTRQLALKLLANVTYGYTAASFSGRQPCADLADAIVDSGRKTLEAAIHVAGGYGAELPVKYGDTDSIFVECRGMSVEGAREHALRRIKDVVDAGTPPGVELKFEYVFDGCVLVTKKRYVGYAVEDPGGAPHLLVKGLEVKTRDNCDFVRHRLEVCVRELLRHRDLSLVKRRVLETMEGVDAASLRDLILWRNPASACPASSSAPTAAP
ncbi:DNA polymerase [Aureococcus anophagefferens]|nr:DNA polymerase [Aureococcus anophagefferens]